MLYFLVMLAYLEVVFGGAFLSSFFSLRTVLKNLFVKLLGVPRSEPAAALQLSRQSVLQRSYSCATQLTRVLNIRETFLDLSLSLSLLKKSLSDLPLILLSRRGISWQEKAVAKNPSHSICGQTQKQEQGMGRKKNLKLKRLDENQKRFLSAMLTAYLIL